MHYLFMRLLTPAILMVLAMRPHLLGLAGGKARQDGKMLSHCPICVDSF